MPEMNGEMLCRRIQETERLKNVPIVLISAKGLELDLNRLRSEFGVSEVVFKPFSPNGLVAAVEACFNKDVGVCR
jgi:two-component system alkaline phosphatase synthesis response regulator PhoP